MTTIETCRFMLHFLFVFSKRCLRGYAQTLQLEWGISSNQFPIGWKKVVATTFINCCSPRMLLAGKLQLTVNGFASWVHCSWSWYVWMANVALQARRLKVPSRRSKHVSTGSTFQSTMTTPSTICVTCGSDRPAVRSGAWSSSHVRWPDAWKKPPFKKLRL